MHRLVKTPNRKLEDRCPYVGGKTIASLRSLAEPLRGARVLNLSLPGLNPEIAEQLHEVVALLCDLGVEAEWRVVEEVPSYTRSLRSMREGLLGRPVRWTEESAQSWRQFSKRSLRHLELPYDVIVLHDPRLLGLCADPTGHLAEDWNTRWVWHCHDDLSSARLDVLGSLLPAVSRCSVCVFPDYSFVPQAIADLPLLVIPPAISPRHGDSLRLSRQRRGSGHSWPDSTRPLLAQVSPLQRGFDPTGAVNVYLRAKRKRPELQLLLVDPRGTRAAGVSAAIEGIARTARGDPDIHVLACRGDEAAAAEHAAHAVATVAMQLAVPSGFSLPIWRAQWQERPVVVGKSGSLATQIVDGVTGYVAGDEADFADAILDLLSDPARAARIGTAGHELVNRKYLFTRLLADELSMLRVLLASVKPDHEREMVNHV